MGVFRVLVLTITTFAIYSIAYSVVRVQEHFPKSALPSFPGTVRSDGDGGFGEGLHVVLHVERGVDEAHTERGRDAAACRKGEREIVGLNVQEVRLERGREGFGEVRDAFRRGIVEEDEAAAFGSGAESAEESGGFSLECGRKILQQAEERGVLLCRAECLVAACSLLACHLIRLCGKREPEERAVCGKLPRDLLPEGQGFGRLAVLVEQRERHGRFGVRGEGGYEPLLPRGRLFCREDEQRSPRTERRPRLARDACEAHGQFFEPSEAVNGLGEAVDALLASGHGESIERGERRQSKVVGRIIRVIGHDFRQEAIRHRFHLVLRIICLRCIRRSVSLPNVLSLVVACRRILCEETFCSFDRSVEEVSDDGRSRRFAEAKAHVHIRREAELLENGGVRRLCREVRGQKVARDCGCERLGNQGCRARVEAVEDDDGSSSRRTEDQSCDAAKLEAADLLQHVDAVARVGAVDGEDLAHDFDFLFQAFVGDVRAAPRRLLGRKTAQAGGDRCARRRVRYAHFAWQEAAAAFGGEVFGEADADGERAERFLARHGGSFGGVLRAVRNLAVDERRERRQRRLDAKVGDMKVASGEVCERIGDRALGEQVVRRHLRRRLGRIGADLHFGDAVIGAADQRAFLWLFEMLPCTLRRAHIAVEEDGECAETDALRQLFLQGALHILARSIVGRLDGANGIVHETGVVRPAQIAS